MAYRLAIAISGAVSLGAYEAGVMYEIIEAIGQHNRQVNNDDDKIVIDVITGASAGGMTAAILSQKLLFEGTQLENPVHNHLYAPWVKMADVSRMLKMDDDINEDLAAPNKSILSSAFIGQIADEFLLKRYKQTNPDKIRHPAAAYTIQLGLALSNLNGIDHHIKTFDGPDLAEPNSQFIYTRFQDQLTVSLNDHSDQASTWEKIALAARACGAFPFAFRALHVPRNRTEGDYDDIDILPSPPENFTDGSFIYTDGGVFNNSPLGMAKKLADRIDIEALDYENRFYIYISPEQKVSTLNAALNETDATFLNVGKSLARSIFQQGRFQDWISVDRYNELVNQFDERAYKLRHLMAYNELSADEIERVSGYLLGKIYEENNIKRQRDFETLKTRFMTDQHPDLEALKNKGESMVNAWLNAVLVLEQSGRLGDRDKMVVHTITAQNAELAGEDMSAFAGFFDRRFRDYDYTTGRNRARLFLTALFKKAEQDQENQYLPLKFQVDATPLPRDQEILKAIQAKNADLNDDNNSLMPLVDESIRKELLKRFQERLGRVLEQIEVPTQAGRWLIMQLVIKKRLKKVLHLT